MKKFCSVEKFGGVMQNLTAILFAILLSVVLTVQLADAKSKKGNFTGKQSTDLPIEITADSLEVRQDKQSAKFTGNVEAIQGDINIRSDVMEVQYRSDQELKSKDKNRVSKITVTGNVFLSTPRETAEGKRGIYNVDAKLLELFGDVVLTRGGNVVEGDNLQYNLETGYSKIMGGNQIKASSGDSAPAKKKRVKGIFIPESAK